MIPEPEFRSLERQLKDERIAYRALAESYEAMRIALLLALCEMSHHVDHKTDKCWSWCPKCKVADIINGSHVERK
jgi:hypothetical protein